MLRWLLFAVLALGGPASGAPAFGIFQVASGIVPVSGLSVLVSPSPPYDWLLLNMAKMAGSCSSTAGVVTADLYPPNGVLASTIQCTITFPTSQWCTASLHCVIDYSGTAGTSGNPGIQIGTQLNNNITVYSSATSCQSTGTTINNIVLYGAGCNAEFSVNTGTGASPFVFKFLAGATFTNLTKVRVYPCQVSCAATAALLTVNEDAVNPDYVACLNPAASGTCPGTVINPAILRMENLLQYPYNVFSDPRDGCQITAFSYANDCWQPALYAGAITGTNTYATTCTSPCTGGIAQSGQTSLQDGAEIQGQFTNANTGAATLNVTYSWGSTGAITLESTQGIALANGNIGANSYWMATYSKKLNAWLITAPITGNQSGAPAAFPIKVLIDIANAAHKNLWFNWGALTTDGGATYVCQQVSALLNVPLKFYTEYDDEIWNSAYPFAFFTKYAQTMGQTWLGISNAANALDSYYGYITKILAADCNSGWSASASRLNPVIAFQEFGNVTNTTNNRNAGALLCGTSCGNSTYQTNIGADYNSAPNRPQDIAKAESYASYTAGAQCNDGGNYSGTASNFAGLTGAADNYASGGSGITSAYAFLTTDFTSGNLNGWQSNINYQVSNIWPAWQTMAQNIGVPILAYEGSLDCTPPTQAQCTSLSISSSYCGLTGSIATMLNAWKASASFQSLTTTWLNDWNTYLNGGAPAWFQLASEFPATTGPPTDQFALSPGDLYAAPYYTSAAALAAFN